MLVLFPHVHFVARWERLPEPWHKKQGNLGFPPNRVRIGAVVSSTQQRPRAPDFGSRRYCCAIDATRKESGDTWPGARQHIWTTQAAPSTEAGQKYQQLGAHMPDPE